MGVQVSQVPRAYIWRRVHSITGLLIVLFLLEHLTTNSQAALLFGDDGNSFVTMVNFLHALPYRPVLEIVLIGIPILVHGALGIKYAISGKFNAHKTDGKKPAMFEHGRNRAYSWQRFTAWIILIGIIGHVTFFRFLMYPVEAKLGDQMHYFVRLDMDAGLYTVSKRLGVTLYDQDKIASEKKAYEQMLSKAERVETRADELLAKVPSGLESAENILYNEETASLLDSAQRFRQKKDWINALLAKPIKPGEVIASSTNFGDLTLLNVRDAFKNVWIAILYTIFVVATSFHAFNGLWTFCITWGVILGLRSQSKMVTTCITIMVIIAALGLVAIWGTYWVNLKY